MRRRADDQGCSSVVGIHVDAQTAEVVSSWQIGGAENLRNLLRGFPERVFGGNWICSYGTGVFDE